MSVIPPLPARIARLPRDHRGFPVPWFVQYFQNDTACAYGVGEPDFRVVDTHKFARAIRQTLCWTCGQPLGRHRVFVIGPMCAINRTISEPPSHRECAQFAARACPFLSRPRMRRNENDLPECQATPGFALARNPGAICLWETLDYGPFRATAGNDGVLFWLGEPTSVEWWANGRPATREEVLAAIDNGFPTLEEIARAEGPDAVVALGQCRARVMPLLPA